MGETGRFSDAEGEVATSASAPSPKSASDERAPLWLLVAAHVVLGLLFSFWSAAQGELPIVLDLLLLVPVFGLTFAQTSLLGFWAVFSSAAWWIRLAGLVGGIVYLEIIFAIGLASSDLLLLVAMATGGIAAVFAVVRWRYARLEHFPQHVSLTAQEGLKFSIRGLMIFTFIVAVALVRIRTLRENPPTGYLPVLALWSLCFAVVGLAGVWAGLGLARPMPRIAVCLLISAVLGLLFVYCVNADEWQSYFYIVSVMVLQAAVLISSLLIVRSCRYRLVRRHVAGVESPNKPEQVSLGQQREVFAIDTISDKSF